MSALPVCPDKIADKPALLAAMLLQKDEEIRELVGALQETREVLAMLTDPERIKQSRVQIAWAQAVAAEAKVRALLAKHTEVSHE